MEKRRSKTSPLNKKGAKLGKSTGRGRNRGNLGGRIEGERGKRTKVGEENPRVPLLRTREISSALFSFRNWAMQ